MFAYLIKKMTAQRCFSLVDENRATVICTPKVRHFWGAYHVRVFYLLNIFSVDSVYDG